MSGFLDKYLMLETPQLEVFFTESVTRKKRQIQLNVNLGKRAGVSTKPMGHIHNFLARYKQGQAIYVII